MREIKFRFFDGEKMLAVCELTFFEGGGYNMNNEFPSTGIDPYPLMQFTGLFDKQGKEIYEGDIIDFVEGDLIAKGSVEFSEGRYVIKLKQGNITLKSYKHIKSGFGIIGNVFQNPELIK